MVRKHLEDQSAIFVNAMISLMKSPHFILITIIGNFLVFVTSICFYLIEHEHNPLVDELMDAVWWAFATVTTVGYGDIIPVTFLGRILGILLMLGGTALFASYIAIFADTFLAFDPRNKK